MLIKELPKSISNKTFTNIQEFVVFVYEEQLVTEFWELSESEVSDKMKKDLKEAQKLSRSDFVNL